MDDRGDTGFGAGAIAGGTMAASARRLIAAVEAAGLGVDAAEADAWLVGLAEAAATPQEFAWSDEAGVGGHELALLDVDHAAPEFARLRRLAALVRTPTAPDVRAALAVAGSAAQNRIQPFSADVDFFERVHLVAPSREAAARRVGRLVAGSAAGGPLTLVDLLCGRLPTGGIARWRPGDLAVGWLRVGDDASARLGWEEAIRDPGFIKVSWFAPDPEMGGPLWVSKVVDVTWEGPSGRVESLDGEIDADFQQVYLDKEASALAVELTTAWHVGLRSAYVRAMEREIVAHRWATPANDGKAAKRLYNLCRLTGRRGEALFLRELFDESACRLYGVRTALTAVARAVSEDGRWVAVERRLRGLLDELAAAGCSGEVSRAAEACREGIAASSEVERAALVERLAALDAVLAAEVSGGFRARMEGFPPVAALLAELERRHVGASRGAVPAEGEPWETGVVGRVLEEGRNPGE